MPPFFSLSDILIGDIFEMMMLLCFAVSWPFNIMKSYRARTAAGKSIMFEVFVEIGYFCGIIAKFLNDDVDFVLAFYVLDIGLVATDMALYFRNRKLDREKCLGS